MEVELGCEGSRDISEKEQGEGRGDEDTLFYCEGTECTTLYLEGARTYRLENWMK